MTQIDEIYPIIEVSSFEFNDARASPSGRKVLAEVREKEERELPLTMMTVLAPTLCSD